MLMFFGWTPNQWRYVRQWALQGNVKGLTRIPYCPKKFDWMGSECKIITGGFSPSQALRVRREWQKLDKPDPTETDWLFKPRKEH